MTMDRRQALKTMGATAAAAWVVPEILIAQPAGGATLSGPVQPESPAPGEGTPAFPEVARGPQTLASTGMDLKLTATTGAALVAGGWALHHWSPRIASEPDHG